MVGIEDREDDAIPKTVIIAAPALAAADQAGLFHKGQGHAFL